MTSIFIHLRHFHVYYELMMGLMSYFMNFLVIYLALYKSTRAMREYNIIILLNACVDLVFNTTNIVTMQLADITFGKLYFTNSGLLEKVPQPYSLIACVFWMFGLYLTVLNVAMQFLYRYNVLCKEKSTYLREFAVIYSLCCLYIAIQSLLGFFCFETNEGNSKYLIELKQNGLFEENTPPFSVVDALKAVNETGTLKGAFHLANTNLITTCSYIVVFWTGSRIHKTLRESRKHMSAATLAVQRQLTIILLLQAVYPFTFLATPIFLAAGLPLFHIKAPALGLVLVCMTTFLPLMNSLTVIFVVPSFRRAILFQSRRTSISGAPTSKLDPINSIQHHSSRNTIDTMSNMY